MHYCYTGGVSVGSPYYDDILEYDVEEEAWSKVGSMSMKRASHAVSVINYLDIKDYCT